MKLKVFLLYLFIFLTSLSYSMETLPKVTYKEVELNSLEDIDKWKNSDELYIFSKINIDLRKLSIKERKDTFINILLPAIEVVNSEIRNNKEIVEKLSKKVFFTNEEKEYLKDIFKKYRVEFGDWETLKSRFIIYPTSLILTQGAIESGWGTSRFFREANNLFGMTSPSKKEPRIASKEKPSSNGVLHFKKYDSVKDSVADLVLNFSRNRTFSKVKNYIHEQKPPHVIATGLLDYSEQKEVYVKKVISTMKYNKFTEYDTLNL